MSGCSLEDMTMQAPANQPIKSRTVQIADLSLAFRDVQVPVETPTGKQLSAAAGFPASQEVVILEVLSNGELEDIRATEVVGLTDSTRRFVIVEADRIYLFTVNGMRYEWPARIISGGQLRKLAQISPTITVVQRLTDGSERVISDSELVDLDSKGVEDFHARPHEWKLNVQGVILTLHQPTIVTLDAIEQAGFDKTKAWIIVLRVKGEPKREIAPDFVIDLRTPGIEKIRLTPKELNNGEAATESKRTFALLDVDRNFLDGLGLRWETIVEASEQDPSKMRRWLLIHDYPIPVGYSVQSTLLGLEIPTTYPGAQIDMFYTYPPLQLASGTAIPSTQVNASIRGRMFNGWSRHRGAASPWDPETDNVSTHLALVDSAMAKETGE
jgi:hypothetical protein